ncbi:MAG: lipoprotein signal peptidase [Bacteroidetes bacterium]|nr:lipoprotein signal peptidase [Bacteroidota bacterium]MDA0950566.1 lipoprotein signal peptidase [Bacteroidota bacterium]
MSLKKSYALVLFILLVDQCSKIYIKTHFLYQEQVEIFSWFRLLFIENRGAAWGTQLSDFLPVSEDVAKLGLTLFRIVAIIGIAVWMSRSSTSKHRSALLSTSIALIFAGALGNLIDSIFYGQLFTESTPYRLAEFAWNTPKGGYEAFFYGRVVDLFYFPIIDTQWPEWVPMLGGRSFRFFEPVFNVADSAISLGLFILIAFNKRVFKS